LKLRRNQAIELVGLAAIEVVEAKNVDYTGRLMDYIRPGAVEFAASVNLESSDKWHTLTAYYYQDAETLSVEGCELDTLDWTVDHYALS
jgi:hypothetical protein